MSSNGNLKNSNSSVRKLKITFLKADSLPYEGTFMLFKYLNNKSYCFVAAMVPHFLSLLCLVFLFIY